MKRLQDFALMIPAIRRLHEGRNSLLSAQVDLTARLAKSAEILAEVQSRLARTEADLAAMRYGTGALLSQAISPFFHFNTVFNVEEIIRRHAKPNLRPCADYLTNFLGVAVDPKFCPQILEGRAGQLEDLPIPGNWHADMAEFAAVLRAVDLAENVFTMIELGCGWGCWMNNAGAAARRAGLSVNLVGIEGDEGHIGFAREALDVNGFDAAHITLHRGIAAAMSGVALFPRQDHAGSSWGLEPIFGATDEQRLQAVQSAKYEELPMIALADAAGPFPRIDLLHIDIQGSEADLVQECLPTLQEKVAYLFVGTHSRQIEGRLFDILLDAGWLLEIERPGLLKLDGESPYMWIDGVQGWRNSALLPPTRP